MRSSLGFKSIGGLLALLVTFVLALPGVKAVRAEGQLAAPSSSDGPQCSPSDPKASIAHSGASMDQLQARIEAQVAARGGSAEGMPILLNNRGYNYGPPPGVRFDALLPGTVPNANEDAR
jgi:hypothetical protein